MLVVIGTDYCTMQCHRLVAGCRLVGIMCPLPVPLIHTSQLLFSDPPGA